MGKGFRAPLTTIHFLPSSWKTGAFSTTGLAAGVGLATGAATGALNGAGPERSAVFLCVCMSEVTFFRPAIEMDVIKALMIEALIKLT